MSYFTLLSMAILAFVGIASADMLMGAATFGWPPPRAWDDTAESISPCGSLDDPSDRTAFSYFKGHVLLFTQAKVWNLQLGASYASRPQKMADFHPIMENVYIAEVDAGITCINVPNAPLAVKAGHPATLQLTYVSDYGSPSGRNMTFYACADVVYVSPSDVPYQVPCLNTTEPKDHFAVLPDPPKLSPTSRVPVAVDENAPPEKIKHHGRPKWVIPVVGMGGALAGLLVAFLCYQTAEEFDGTKRPTN
ncbi:uncharacterized protein Triagg1_8023 [Trichoderma aggressivum f. europaeum]|uniref:Copper acquisition factor BIM1-like domain-containing protein n=1 Tax=Trichoderma aggressivum f. europaeum TaxID=173218 RepID=A0AAE1IAN0_9HYPO|nr:hypothetical protein Triagg1_8023 [Trichoderma aggressivum f. europaeum]